MDFLYSRKPGEGASSARQAITKGGCGRVPGRNNLVHDRAREQVQEQEIIGMSKRIDDHSKRRT